MKSNHRGFTIVEMMAAGAMTVVLVTMCVQMLTLTTVQRRAAERRTIALEEAANLVESVGALSWGEITPERVAQFRISEAAQEILAGGTLKIAIEPSTSGPPAKLVRLEIVWPSGADGRDASVHLSSWVFSHAKAASP